MRNLVSEYVSQFRQDRQKQLKLVAVLAALAVVVAGVVFWQLHNTGVAMTNEVYCGMEEHVHDDSCYEQQLICGSEDADHVHDDSCYETVLVCGLPEHTHTVECLVDETADVETADVWENTLPVMSGIWADDVAAIAESQVGYTESEANYILAEDGTTHQGYNRYGAWYGNEYGDWDAMFASFCLNYAAVPESEVPENSGAYALATALDSEGLYVESTDGFTPATGDMVFFDEDQDGQADRVGIVIAAGENELTVVEGNYEDSVAENTYKNDESGILAFGLLPEQDLAAEAGMYTISYSGEIPGEVEVEGPTVAQEGTDQYFYVIVSEDYEITEITANGEELTAQEVTESKDGESSTYAYLLEDISDDTIVVLDATQVLNGSGSISVYKKNSYEDGTINADYILSVSGVPTNTKISLDSPDITLALADGDGTVSNPSLQGNLYYVAEGQNFANGTVVSYLMLDEEIDDESTAQSIFRLTPYDENGTVFEMTEGNLVLDDEAAVTYSMIWRIQTNTLCYLDGNNNYQQEIVDAAEDFNPLTIGVESYNNGDEVSLSEITGGTYDEFYYGSIDPNHFSLTSCTKGIVENGLLLPVDPTTGESVSGVEIYMVYDHVYSFDVEVRDVVNEHTEDNGDTYLWLGDTFYIDQYHNQGYELYGYCRSQNTLENCGVWVQLGRIREEAINGKIKTFSDYSNVSYKDMLAEGVSLSGYDSQNAADTAEANAPYGIVGPFETEDTKPITSTVRVTGHIGDAMTAAEVFGADTVYMIVDQDLNEEWFNLGSHASDNGLRAWFYWIKDYYVLNNYEDEVEYLEIYEKNGEVHLQADEMGEDGTGVLDDIWEIEGLFTKRNSVVKEYMLANQEVLESQGIGFAETAGSPDHIQLRINTTVQASVNDVVYSGKLTILDDEALGIQPTVTYIINCTDSEGNKRSVSQTTKLGLNTQGSSGTGDVNQETEQLKLGFAISPEDAFDPEKVQITITIYAVGTLTASNGVDIVYTTDDPLEYTFTMTAEQLYEAYDCCPNSTGYDVAINMSNAVTIDAEDSIILTKEWDDNRNEYGARDNVTFVTVALERSKDGENWEYVYVDDEAEDEDKEIKAFTIRGDADSYIWEQALDGNDLDLTYYDEDSGDWLPYQFRIASEQDIIGVKDGYEYTYTLGWQTTPVEGYDFSLFVMNALTTYQEEITGMKQWLDQDGNPLADGDSRIPDSIVIGLYQNDEFYDKLEVTSENNWAFTFTDLPQTVEDSYTYTLYELDSDGNRVDGDGLVLIDGNLYHVKVEPGNEENGTGDYDFVISNTVFTGELPVTGGSGTWIYTAVGLLLIGGAAVTLIYRKRRAVRS